MEYVHAVFRQHWSNTRQLMKSKIWQLIWQTYGNPRTRVHDLAGISSGVVVAQSRLSNRRDGHRRPDGGPGEDS
jgi:hypothetical protein